MCGYRGRFINSGTPVVLDAHCPSCGATPRHRLFQLVQSEHSIIPAGSDILHFAAERYLRNVIAATRPKTYQTADIRPGFDLQLNLEDINLPDESVDVVIASHVLEHVNDRKALAGIHRILRERGRGVFMVPIIEGWDETYENPAVTDWHDRKRHFGGGTHIRYYGRDFRDRIKEAGFELKEYTMTPLQALDHRLVRGERIFLAVKNPK